MYLNHFGLREFPFTLTPSLRFFCTLTAYQEALNVVMVSLHNHEGFIKITGEVGVGKTLLCRKLLNSLGSEYVTAYIANAIYDPLNLQKAIASELEIVVPEQVEPHHLLMLLTNKLIKLNYAGKRVVIIIDEAHTLADETLEGLRLLSNLETESSKLMQIILVGQPELDTKLQKNTLRQLAQRIIFSYNIATLTTPKELVAYLGYRLTAAGYRNTCDNLFTRSAIKTLLKASKGIPRLVNILCHKSFLIAYAYNQNTIDNRLLKMAIADTECITAKLLGHNYRFFLKIFFSLLAIITGIGIINYILPK